MKQAKAFVMGHEEFNEVVQKATDGEIGFSVHHEEWFYTADEDCEIFFEAVEKDLGKFFDGKFVRLAVDVYDKENGVVVIIG